MSQKQSATRLKKLINRSLSVFLGLVFLTTTVKYIQSSILPDADNGNIKIVYIQENSLVGISNPCHVNQEEEKRDKDIEVLLAKIIRRESGGNPEICNEGGCGGGMGLCQIISSTWNGALEKMEKDNIYMPEYCWQKVNANVSKDDPPHPIYNPECHLTVCEWLLRTDGIQHWENWSGPY